MPIDLANKAVGQRENLLKNYRDNKRTDSEDYIDALRALEPRRSKGLDLQKTSDFIIFPHRRVSTAHGLQSSTMGMLSWDGPVRDMRSWTFARSG